MVASPSARPLSLCTGRLLQCRPLFSLRFLFADSHVQMDALLSLLAAMLLERRIIVVASDRERVTSAVHAAAAMLYPFRWQHIYLPLLPTALRVSQHFISSSSCQARSCLGIAAAYLLNCAASTPVGPERGFAARCCIRNSLHLAAALGLPRPLLPTAWQPPGRAGGILSRLSCLPAAGLPDGAHALPDRPPF